MVKRINVKKGDIIQRPGETDTKVFVVRSGLLRSYLIDEKGKEHIFLFAPEGTVMADHLPSHVPADLYIEALEDSVVVVRQKNLAIVRRDAHKIIWRISALQKRVIMLMSSSIVERYQHFLEAYPEISERIPQKMIASYLGVTPEALSKAKSQYLQSK